MQKSNALPSHFYRDPSLVAEQNQLKAMGCQACEYHSFHLGRVICVNQLVTNHKRVPFIGHKCKYFKLKVIKNGG
jgi:hypothetical protein